MVLGVGDGWVVWCGGNVFCWCVRWFSSCFLKGSRLVCCRSWSGRVFQVWDCWAVEWLMESGLFGMYRDCWLADRVG